MLIWKKWDSVAKYSAMAIEDNQLMPAGTYLGGLGDIYKYRMVVQS